ncbi:translation initiation factor IF-2 [Acidithrix ferrooxidans]|uniref:Translation initiation factor IF-2 n=1 Tax=Acidithrix ferrooxidans TaxID=1280514 RepID=A0A0D8HPE1_9ACTN|nr:translation initiation factor IF-2 [Acidithrix ferrooxidans]KJF18981.1 translation initiation factor IF-2 [Acidithrix ferrooxidans]
MAKRIRVYDLAKELGLSNKGAFDLCNDLGMGIKSPSSSIEDAQADRARRKVVREGAGRYERAGGGEHSHGDTKTTVAAGDAAVNVLPADPIASKASAPIEPPAAEPRIQVKAQPLGEPQSESKAPPVIEAKPEAQVQAKTEPLTEPDTSRHLDSGHSKQSHRRGADAPRDSEAGTDKSDRAAKDNFKAVSGTVSEVLPSEPVARVDVAPSQLASSKNNEHEQKVVKSPEAPAKQEEKVVITPDLDRGTVVVKSDADATVQKVQPAPEAENKPENKSSSSENLAPKARDSRGRVFRSTESHGQRSSMGPNRDTRPPVVRNDVEANSAPSLEPGAKGGSVAPPPRPRVPLSLSGKPIPPPPGMGSNRQGSGGRYQNDSPNPRQGDRPGFNRGPRPGGGFDRNSEGGRQGNFGDRPDRGAGQGNFADRGPRPGGGQGNFADRGPRPGGGQGNFADRGPRPGGAGQGGGGGFPRSGPSTGFAPRTGGGFPGSRTPTPSPGGAFGGKSPAGSRGRPLQRAAKRRSRKNMEELEPTQVTSYIPSNAPVPDGEIIIERGSSAQEVGPKFNRSAGDVVRFLLLQGEPVTATQTLSDDAIELFAAELGAKVKLVDPGQEQEAELYAKYFSDDDIVPQGEAEWRAPVVTVMGHVDHGKTKLLDRIRETNVVAKEAGGITQHIGAYRAQVDNKFVTFIDTPGHEAFTAMRARGAGVTDIVVLVVAADDGVMPQTIEAIDHAKAAHVPIVVAINKIDRADADPNRVMQQLSEYGLVPEAWGGDTIMVELSALQNLGVDDLLEQLVVLAEVLELTSTKVGRAKGVVLEANLDPGRGPVATVIVKQGVLRVGSNLVAGPAFGRVKALIDEAGNPVHEAEPSTPVQVLGFSEVPSAGDEFRETAELSVARQIGSMREQRIRLAGLSAQSGAAPGAKLEDLFEQIKRGETATLNVIIKADVQGSLEAVTESLRKLERPEVKLSIVRRAVGGINENDVSLGAASNALIIGFNVRPDRRGREAAEAQHVEIRTYEIIYKMLEDIEAAMVGMLAPEYEEVVTGEAEVRDIFRVPKVGAVAGCYVQNGSITRGSKVRFLRDGVVIWKGSITSLRRFKDDVREVASGFECGIGLSDFQDLRSGDIIETFEDREIPRAL